MQKNPRPTRAECTDVANAIFDGADCVMLSGESAKGKYPVGAVSMMQKIINSAESSQGEENDVSYIPVPDCTESRDSIAIAAVAGSRAMNATCILVKSKTGRTAKAIAKFRPSCPVIAFVSSPKHGRMLQMYRGIHPVLLVDSNSSPGNLVEKAKHLGFISAGDKASVVTAEAENEKVSSTLSMHIVTAK